MTSPNASSVTIDTFNDGSLAETLGYSPTVGELKRVAQSAVDNGWTDISTPEHKALVAALPLEDIAPSELHFLMLLACGAANIAGNSLGWASRRFFDNDVVEITAILPGGVRLSVYGQFGNPRDVSAMTAFVARWWGRANLYYGVNPRGTHMIGAFRASNATDVVCRHQVVFDHDGAPDDPAERPRWERQVLAKHRREWISDAVRSGNGVQIIYDVEVQQGYAAVKEGQFLLHHLYRAVGSDPAVGNPDRVFRLPYTLNIPGVAKRSRGRTLVLATVMTDIDHV